MRALDLFCGAGGASAGLVAAGYDVGGVDIEPQPSCLDVQRHRYFETSFAVDQPPCDHGQWTPRFPPATNRTNLRKTVEIGVWRIPLDVQQKAMGIDWMSLKELSQAIPPAYAYLLGELARSRAPRKRPSSQIHSSPTSS